MASELSKLIAGRLQQPAISPIQVPQYVPPANQLLNRRYRPEWWEILGRSIVPQMVQRYEQNSVQQATDRRNVKLAQTLQQMPKGEDRVQFLLQNGMPAEAMAVAAEMEDRQSKRDDLTYELEQKKKFIYDPQMAMEQARIDETRRHHGAMEGLRSREVNYQDRLLKAQETAARAQAEYEDRKAIIDYATSANEKFESNQTIKNFRMADNNLQTLMNIEADTSMSPSIKEFATAMIYLKTQNGENVNQGDIDAVRDAGGFTKAMEGMWNRAFGEGTSLRSQLPSMRKVIAQKAQAMSKAASSLVDQSRGLATGLVRNPASSQYVDAIGQSLEKAFGRVDDNVTTLGQRKAVGFGRTR